MTSKTNESATVNANLLVVFDIFLRGMASGAIKGEPEQYRQFRDKMQTLADLNGEEASSPQLVAKAKAAVNLLQNHCARASGFFQAQIAELLSVMELLVGTLTDLAVAKPDDLLRLRKISQQIHTAADSADVHQGKLAMVKCTEEIRRAAERGVGKETEADGRDTVTNLPGRPAAEAALVEACASENPGSAVVLLLDRLKLYNQRYGREVGDMTLRFFSDFLRGSMEGEYSLFRWTGPALLMISPAPPDKIQPEVRRILEPRLQFECESGSRHMLLSVDATWSVLPLMVDPRLLINKIDALAVI
jgi:GGDEF domain-containing protein